MDTYTKDEAVVSEELWRAWVQKGKVREEATARKLKVVAGFTLGLFASGTAIYVFLAK